MANKKISEDTLLTAAASAVDDDYIPVIDASEAQAADRNKRMMLEELAKAVVQKSDAFAQSGIGAVAEDVQEALRRVAVYPEQFGAVGDGVTDDTDAMQKAWNTLKDVHGSPGATYLVSRTTGKRYALLWKSDMRWRGRGSVIKLADSQYQLTNGCSVIMTESTDDAPTSTVTDTLFDGEVDGNYANQGAIGTSGGFFTPTIYANRIAQTKWNLTIRNAFIQGFYSSGTDAATITVDNELDARVFGGLANGVWLAGKRWTIGDVVVKDLTFNDATNAQGNPFIVSIKDSIIGKIYAENFGYGVKFQNGCENIAIDQIIAKQGSSATTERLVKFQGTATTAINKNIQVGKIIAVGGKGNGLYIFETNGIEIGSYIGYQNGSDTGVGENERADVYITDALNVDIASIKSIERQGQYSVVINNTADNINIGKLTVVEPPLASSYVLYNKAGSAGQIATITVGTITVRAATGWARQVIAAAGYCNILADKVVMDLPYADYITNGMNFIATAGGTQYIRTGPWLWKGKPTSETVTLDNNATSKAVAAAAVAQGDDGIAFSPIILVELVGSSLNNNSALLRFGTKVSVKTLSTGGGLTIQHGPTPASGAYYARYTILGYTAPGGAFSALDTNALTVDVQETAANLAAKTHAINTGGKYTGKLVWDTTNTRMMRASGATDVSTWVLVDGSVTVTPA